MSEMMEMEFPAIYNSGKAQTQDGKVTFSYLDSLSRPRTETKPLMEATEVLQLIRQRMKRFKTAPPGARESARSRRERKYIAAQPEKILREAWEDADEYLRMEFSMMLSENSHHGISDPAWLKKHAGPRAEVPGDNGPLDREAQGAKLKVGVLLLALLFVTLSVFAQGAAVHDIVISSSGRPVGGATFRVCGSSWAGLAVSSCTPISSIYAKDNVWLTTPAANPGTADALGNIDFAIAPGVYWIQISGAGLTTRQHLITAAIAGSSLTEASLYVPGTSTGLVSAPTVMPGGSVVLSGGSIADGTYYFKITYKNLNGETTASPTRTFTVAGGAGSARINIGEGDFNWRAGAYGYRVYASNDNVNFYLQTPTPVVADFMVDATTHYVALGSFGARLNSLAFSGTTPPLTNTAVIDPLQVGLNATRNANGTPAGVLFVPAFTLSQTTWTVTTPLIMISGDRVMGAASYLLVNGQSRIFMANANPKLAAVMWFGGDGTLDNVGVQNSGHAFMLLGGAGLQSGQRGTWIDNVEFRSSDVTNTYDAFVVKGIVYHLKVGKHHFRGGRALISYQNAVGEAHVFREGRWDAGGPNYIKSIPGWTDPDNGAHDAAFPFGVTGISIRNTLAELGTGIVLDCVGLGMEFDDFRLADVGIVAGTDSIAKFGTDLTYGGASGVRLHNTSFGNAATRVGTMLAGLGSSLWASGNSSFGIGGNTGSSITVDFNNAQALFVLDTAGAIGSTDPLAAAATPHVINMHDNTFLAVKGDHDGVANALPWSFVTGRLVFATKTGANWTRSTHFSIVNRAGGTGFTVQGIDNATDQLSINASVSGANDSFAMFRGNARVNAGSANASQFSIGPSSSTAVGGSLSLVNSGSAFMRNAANTADVRLIAGDASDRAIIGDAAGVCLSTSTNCAPIKGNLSATASLDFTALAANSCEVLTVALTGVVDGESVFLGVPTALADVDGATERTTFYAWVSAADVVSVRRCNVTATITADPPAATVRVTTLKF